MSMQQRAILRADDDTDDCLFFKDALAGTPMYTKFTAVHNGGQLMNLLNSKTKPLPHVLFLDLNMPRKNGFECLSEIMQHEKLRNLPVIIFSTSFEQEVVNRLYDNGALYFIRKPSEFAWFKKIILHVLTLVLQSQAGGASSLQQPLRENFVFSVDTIRILKPV